MFMPVSKLEFYIELTFCVKFILVISYEKNCYIFLTYCPYCIAAKKIFENHKLKYNEILVDGEPEERKNDLSVKWRQTVPQIFFDGIILEGMMI